MVDGGLHCESWEHPPEPVVLVAPAAVWVPAVTVAAVVAEVVVVARLVVAAAVVAVVAAVAMEERAPPVVACALDDPVTVVARAPEEVPRVVVPVAVAEAAALERAVAEDDLELLPVRWVVVPLEVRELPLVRAVVLVRVVAVEVGPPELLVEGPPEVLTELVSEALDGP
jgi:hypothetical protein